MLLTALVFFIILSILVFVHELGHFAVARWIGVAVEEFGFGLPPRIWGKKIGKTIYSVNWLPIGGFVRLAGEDDENKGRPSKQLFWARSKKERAAILLAGVCMNFILAVGITTYLLTLGVYEPAGRVHVENVVTASPADVSGLKKDDIILKADGKTIAVPRDLIEYTNSHKGTEITLQFERSGVQFTTKLTPRTNVPKGEGPMGVAVSDLELKTYPLTVAPWEALRINILRAKDMFVGLGSVVAKIATLKPLGGDVAGPIGIAQVTGQAVKFGIRAVLEFMSILSLNLAVLNVLPIPALDGGRLLFVVLEKALGRKIGSAFERSAHQIGMIILLALVALISINDILRLARGG